MKNFRRACVAVSFLVAMSGQAYGADGTDLQIQFVERPGVMEFTGQMIVRPNQVLYGATNPRPDASPERPWRPGDVDQNALAAEFVDQARARIAPQVIEHFGEVDEYIVLVPEGMDENTYAQQLMATGDYQYVTPNWLCFKTDTVPNDPDFGSSWQHGVVESAKAWDLYTGDASIIVAVVDSGADLDHPDLAARWVTGFNAQQDLTQTAGGVIQDENGHGTFVAGCAAATGNNGFQVVGMGWNFSVMPIRVTAAGTGGSAFSADLDQGARWAADNGASVINVSFSGVDGANVQTTGAYAKARDALYFRSAGNDSRNLSGFDHADVIVVGASTISDNRASFSAFGRAVDLTAPGADVRSTRNGGTQGTGSGTSFSAPIAAGVAGMIMGSNPSLSVQDVEDILFSTCDDIGAPGEDDEFGFGRVNLFRAVSEAMNPVDISISPLAALPAELVAGASTPLDVRIDVLNDTFVAPPLLQFRRSGEVSFTAIELQDLGDGLWRGTLPAMACGEDPEYRFSVVGAAEGLVTFPETDLASAIVGTVVVSFEDNAETDTGWTVSGITAQSAGAWARGLPQGFDRGDPAQDFDGSGRAWLTGIISGVSNSDVDDGTTILTSTALNIEAGDVLSYAYWLNDVANGRLQGGDSLAVAISSDNGSSFTQVRNYTTASGEWRTDALVAGVDFEPSSNVRIRFSASDIGTQNVVEAGVDALVISAVECDDAPVCVGDIADDFGTAGADGQVSFGDFLALLGLIGPCPGGAPGCAGDFADDFGTLGADGQVSFGDFLALLGLIGPC